MIGRKWAAEVILVLISAMAALVAIQHSAFFYSGIPDPSKLVAVPIYAYVAVAAVLWAFAKLYAIVVVDVGSD